MFDYLHLGHMLKLISDSGVRRATFRSKRLKRIWSLPFFSFPELDLFGIILYSVLTFMAAVSMLVFLEECVYVYRKVPVNKKNVIIWVNGAAPVRIKLHLKFRIQKKNPKNWGPHMFCSFTQPVCLFPGDCHYVLLGDVDPPSHHVYWHDLGLVGVSIPAAVLLTFHRSLCSAFCYQRAPLIKKKIIITQGKLELRNREGSL